MKMGSPGGAIKGRGQGFNQGNPLPVESVGEYFEYFPILEIDYTFYRPLLESKGSPSSNYHVLKSRAFESGQSIGQTS